MKAAVTVSHTMEQEGNGPVDLQQQGKWHLVHSEVKSDLKFETNDLIYLNDF